MITLQVTLQTITPHMSCPICKQHSHAVLWCDGFRPNLNMVWIQPGQFRNYEFDVKCEHCGSIFVGELKTVIDDIQWFCTWDTSKARG